VSPIKSRTTKTTAKPGAKFRAGRRQEAASPAAKKRKKAAAYSPAAKAHLGDDDLAQLKAFAAQAPELWDEWRQASRALRKNTESLAAVQAGLEAAVFHLPRASEFEPLADPLRQFAAMAAPILACLREQAQKGAALVAPALTAPAASPPYSDRRMPSELASLLDNVAIELDIVRTQLVSALATLPSAADYQPIARQLRAIASVSPSLLDWMQEIPKISTPLADSIASLKDAAEQLKTVEERLRHTIRDLKARPA
jgi:ABC-type transporter Mla subunit MlaD